VTETTTTNGKPHLDADSFQKLLAAAYVLQEHNDQLRASGLATLDVPPAADKHSEPADILDTTHLAKVAQAPGYTETLAQIVATQQQIHTSQLELQEALHLIADRTREIARADGAAVGLLESQKFVYRAASGTAAPLVGSKFVIASSLSARSLVAGESFQSANAYRDFSPEFCRRYAIKALITVPIFYEGKVVGAVELHSAAPGAFREHDVRTCQLMAGLVTEAMARASEVEWKQAITAERSTMLEALDQLQPQLQRLVDQPQFAQEKNAETVSGVAAAVPELQDVIPCIECGNILEGNQLFCGRCGAQRPATTPETPTTWPFEPSRKAATAAPANGRSFARGGEDFSSAAAGDGSTSVTMATPQPALLASSPQTALAVQPALAKTPLEAKAKDNDASMQKSYPWTSAVKAKAWLDTHRKTAAGSTLLQLWNSRRADIYLIAAVILVLIAIRWIIWSKPAPGAAGSSNTVAASSGNSATRRKKPAAPQLTLMEQLLVSMGLAEPPPTPTYTGNPNTQVWVDLHTALYYCPGADLYGKTPKGKFTSQRDAQMDQFEPAYRQACD
jgi:putative methionine-R-sulfoxide reductase with GAF domain